MLESFDAQTALSAAMLKNGVECSVEEIKRAMLVRNDYTQVSISKKGGGKRNLLVPPLELKYVQDSIRKWLQKIWPFFNGVKGMSDYRLYGFGYSYAFRPVEGEHFSVWEDGSYADHAFYHKDSNWFFQFDLKDAFYSVKLPRMQKIISLGLRNGLDLKFKTPITESSFWENRKPVIMENGQAWQVEGQYLEDSSMIEKVVELIIYLLSFNEVLPQGAPSSPFLFFLYLMEDPIIRFPVRETRIPRGLWPWVVEIIPPEWKVSGYIDNVCISGKRRLPDDIKNKVLNMFKRAGFSAHKLKEQHIRHGSPTICGLRISDYEGRRKVILARERVRQIRAMIWQWQNGRGPFQARRIKGMIASLMPIYGSLANLPAQIKKPIEKIGWENILRAAREEK